ncbi:hypothetical protein WJX73_003922 [Symbiochloris irregularis]|uniref:Sulfate transporter n=1 Tax=Symbiochloris irregularis TaxID=706552 RepID=A0AAW1NR47_9CHLO
MSNQLSTRLGRLRYDLTLSEISGAFGDLGTFLPLLVALVRTCGLDLGTSLIFTGLYNVASGLIGTLNWIVPGSVVRGIQLAVGLNLAVKGVTLALLKGTQWRPLTGSDSIWPGVAAFVFILLALFAQACRSSEDKVLTDVRQTRLLIPAALIVVLVGLLWTGLRHPQLLKALQFGPTRPHFVMPSRDEWLQGIVKAGLPQIPLTLLNSVVAVCQLANDKFPDRPASPRMVAISVGIMNVIGPWLGALPCCHGAGGLAAQVRFGAQTGAAPIFLGAVKLILGLAFGSSLFALLQAFPMPLLGAMLVFAGIELASSCQVHMAHPGGMLMLITAAAILALKNTGLGFLAGLAAAWCLALVDACQSWLAERRRQRGYHSVNNLSGSGGHLAIDEEGLLPDHSQHSASGAAARLEGSVWNGFGAQGSCGRHRNFCFAAADRSVTCPSRVHLQGAKTAGLRQSRMPMGGCSKASAAKGTPNAAPSNPQEHPDNTAGCL